MPVRITLDIAVDLCAELFVVGESRWKEKVEGAFHVVFVECAPHVTSCEMKLLRVC